MKKDYDFYFPDPKSIDLYKIDRWDNPNKYYAQYISPKATPYNIFKIKDNVLEDIDFGVMDNFNYETLINEVRFDMFIFNIGFIKQAIYIYNKLTNYFEGNK